MLPVTDNTDIVPARFRVLRAGYYAGKWNPYTWRWEGSSRVESSVGLLR